MKKLSQMAAAASRMTSPSQDSNVWTDFMVTLAAGVVTRWPDDQRMQAAEMKLFERTLHEGLNGQSLRALKLATSLRATVNKMEGGLE